MSDSEQLRLAAAWREARAELELAQGAISQAQTRLLDAKDAEAAAGKAYSNHCTQLAIGPAGIEE